MKVEQNNMMRIKRQTRDVIRKICRDLRVKRVDLVGSAARDDFQPGASDIDILVEFVGLTSSSTGILN